MYVATGEIQLDFRPLALRMGAFVMTDYENLKEFWNSNKAQPEKLEGRWIEDETFNRVVSEGVKGSNLVLDYGCGFGWGLFEMSFMDGFRKGIGMDTSSNAIDYCRGSATLSGMDNLEFLCGDEALLDSYRDGFDFILTVNTLDVVPQEVCDGIMQRLSASLKSGGRMAVCLNPEFSEDDFKEIGIEFVGSYGYKNGILRANRKSHDEWRRYFERYLRLVEFDTFYLTNGERKYPPRMLFLLEK